MRSSAPLFPHGQGSAETSFEAHGALQEQGVDERLRQIASQLALPHVVLLGEESRRPTGRTRAFEPAVRADAERSAASAGALP
jgi:hypothetical protein